MMLANRKFDFLESCFMIPPRYRLDISNIDSIVHINLTLQYRPGITMARCLFRTVVDRYARVRLILCPFPFFHVHHIK